jgi:hypothetical protein
VKPFAEANHAPVVVLAHAADLAAKAGETVKLSAQGTSDPDGNRLTYRWWQYAEADTYTGAVNIAQADAPNASFVAPRDAVSGDTVHIICEVTDNGSPALTRYQRVIVTIK